MKLDELPLDLLFIICDFAFIRNNPDSRLESNIKTLCSMDLISSVLSRNYEFRGKLEAIWKIILLSYLGIVLNDDEQGTVNVLRSGFSFQVADFENTLEKASKKTFKRCFGLIRECEKRIGKRRFQGFDIDTKSDRTVSISVVGMSGSGVKSMLYRYFENKYIGDDIGMMDVNDYNKEINIGDRVVNFQFRNGSAYQDRYLRDS